MLHSKLKKKAKLAQKMDFVETIQASIGCISGKSSIRQTFPKIVYKLDELSNFGLTINYVLNFNRTSPGVLKMAQNPLYSQMLAEVESILQRTQELIYLSDTHLSDLILLESTVVTQSLPEIRSESLRIKHVASLLKKFKQ